MDTPIRLFFIRHGEVEERYHRIFGGRIDMALSLRGREQARTLAEWLRPVTLDRVYLSPMRRVRETAEPLLTYWRQEPRVLDDLREVDFGAWTGLGWDDIRARFGKSAYDWLEHLQAGEIPDAEEASRFRERCQRALQQALGERAGTSVAVICHGGVVRMLLSILLDLPLAKLAGFDVEYASVTIVDWLPRKAEVQLLNFTPWRQLP